ncbi:MAG: transcription elongation factor GreA [Caldilineae bacterium]|nr:MAG: transcription elongation factor GreA [Caldilineae bacterium]
MVTKPVYLTPEGKKKLEEELHYLRTVKRAEIAAAIQSAKEEGDLAENSAYDEAKSAQAFLEGRIQTLEAQLREAVIIEDASTDVVSLGNTVTVVEEGAGEPETYKIVGSAESNPLNGNISNESPIGSALLGKKVGDEVTVKTPGGEVTLRILNIA